MRTSKYSAPELIKYYTGESLNNVIIDDIYPARCDVFSFGLIIY